MKGRFVFLLFTILAKLSQADLPDLHAEVLNEANGLSSKIVNCFMQDSRGYMWVGTAEGLNRYDGYSFKVYRKTEGDSSSLLSNNISCLKEDSDHHIWIGYVNGGLSCFDPLTQKFIHYLPNKKVHESIPGEGVNFIFIDKENTLWLGIFQHGLIRFDRQTKTFYAYPTLPDINTGYTPELQKNYNSINNIYETNDGLFWLFTRNGLYTFDRKTNVFTSKRDKPIVAYQWRDDGFGPFVVGGDTAFWIGSWGGGVSYYNIRTNEWKIFKFQTEFLQSGTHNIVTGMCWKNKNEIWLATSQAFGIFNIREQKFYLTNNAVDKSGNGNLYYQTYKDRDNNVWFSNNRGIGLIRANASLFSLVKVPAKKSMNGDFYAITSIYKDTVRHQLLLGTGYADGLHVIDEKSKSEKVIDIPCRPNDDPASIISDIKKDSKGRIWITSRDYIFQYDASTQKLVKIPQPTIDTSFKRSPYFYLILEDSSHSIWITTLRYGVFKLNPETFAYTHFDHNDSDTSSLHSRSINSIAEDKMHRIWFGNGQIGLSCYDGKKFQSFSHNDSDAHSLRDNVITWLANDKQGSVWVSTYGGISKMEITKAGNVSFSNYTSKDGLPSEVIGSIMFDKDDNLWFSSFGGLSKFNLTSHEIKNYTVKDGLIEDYLAYNFCTSDDGELFLGAYKGYFRFYPNITRSEISGPVVLNSFKVFDKERPLEEYKAFKLTPKENFFSFEFATINFSNPENTQYAYKLEGFDENWIYCGDRRYASYTNLDGGKYTFKVKSRNSEGKWTEPTTASVFIETPLYKNVWFIVFLASAFSGFIYFLYHYRIRQIETTERLKTKFNQELSETRMQALRAQMNPHFIFNCLNSINRYIIKSDIKTASLYLTKFAKLIRLILDNSENKKVVLSHELEALKLYIEMEALRFDNKFSYHLHIDSNVGTDSIEVPPLLIQPYVENAIWHGLLHKEENGHLAVNVSRMNGNLVCEIEDNGVGREKSKQLKSKTAVTRKSVGMKLTEERLKILNESTHSFSSVKIVDLQNETGEASGTKVILQIPV